MPHDRPISILNKVLPLSSAIYPIRIRVIFRCELFVDPVYLVIL